MALLFDPSKPLNHTIIASYNDFLDEGVQDVIRQLPPIRIEAHEFKLGRAEIHKPGHLEADDGTYRPLTRDDAYARELDYRAMLRVQVLDEDRLLLQSQLMCFLPLMVGCAHDPEPLQDEGGYFIVGGSEKFIVNAENQRPCAPHFVRDGGAWRCDVVSPHPLTRLVIHDDLTLTVNRLAYKKRVRVVDVLAALGEPAPNALELFVDGGDDLRLHRRIADLSEGRRGDAASLAAVWGEDWRARLTADVLPHVGVTESDDAQKRFWLVRWTRQLIECMHDTRQATDRDHLGEKRVTTAGALMEDVFARTAADFWRKVGLILRLQRELNVEAAIAEASWDMTAALHTMMRTGNVSKMRTGFVRSAERGKTDIAFSSKPRLTDQFLPRGGKMYLPRSMHGSHWGFVCLAQTTSGESIGFTKTPAQTCEFTTRGDEVHWHAQIAECTDPWVPASPRVVLNGRILGTPTESLQTTFERLREARRADPHASVFLERDAVVVDITPGRWVRPVWTRAALDAYPFLLHMTFEKARPLLPSMHELIQRDLVEYICPLSECVVAGTFAALEPFHTHVELDPSLLLGESAARIPWAEHNPAPRIAFYADMAQQAVAMVPDANPTSREALHDENGAARRGPGQHRAAVWETTYNALWYGQSMLNPTWAYRRKPMMPATTNAVLMIMPLPRNQEDSLVENRASRDRGMCRVTRYKVVVEHCGRGTRFGLPPTRTARLRKLGEDGLPAIGVHMQDGDAVACRVERDTRRPHPLYYHGHEPATVEDVVLTTNMDGHQVAKIKLRFGTPTLVGDKFSTMHGQKGTIGQIEACENMPFTHGGITPDLIMNSHAIPSRMTIGQNHEMMQNKAAALAPWPERDSTTFRERHDHERVLHEAGFARTGVEAVYCGFTGEMLEARVFTGVVSYQVLRHFVAAKVHARPTRGLVSVLTRQPRNGRANNGGFRVGQMEGDAMLAWGAAMLLHERFFTSSDGREVRFCMACGTVGWKNADGELVCGNPTCLSPQLVVKHISHTFLLMINELRAMGIAFSLYDR